MLGLRRRMSERDPGSCREMSSDDEDTLYAREQEILREQAEHSPNLSQQARRVRHRVEILQHPSPGVMQQPPEAIPSLFAAPPRPEQDEEPPPPPLALDPSQQRAFDMALKGTSIFLTGGPGTGKSFTTKRIIEALRKKHFEEAVEQLLRSGVFVDRASAEVEQAHHETVMVTAPTGVAAILVKGQTLFTKPGPGRPLPTTEMFGFMWGNKDTWRKVRTLVIDEISMVDGEFLDWCVKSTDEH